MLTATPVRRDRRQMPGEIVYTYSIREAIADGVYWPIAFIPVKFDKGETADDAIARVAIQRLNTRRHRDAGSQLLVRTNKIAEAYRLKALYERKGLELPVLVGTLSAREVNDIVERLEQGIYRGVIVVGVLTEGFDLKRLKIAAYHAKHRSFAATLQFVGRLARTLDDKIIEPELVAIPEDLSGETEVLYQEDASWGQLLPDIADVAVEKERASRHYLTTFIGKPEEFALTAVEPGRYARIFWIEPGIDVDLRSAPADLALRPVWRAFWESDGDLAAIITRSRVHPRWLRSTALDTEQYDLHLAFIDRGRRLLFISSDTEATTAELLAHFGASDAVQLDGEEVGKIVRSFNIEAFSSIGARSDQIDASSGASYKGLAGRAAERGITATDRLTASAGHAIGRFRVGGGVDSIGGAFDSAKIWQSSAGSLLAWRHWCLDIGSRLMASTSSSIGIAGLALRHRLASYPRDVLCVSLAAEIYINDVQLETANSTVHVSDIVLRGRAAGNSVLVGVDAAGKLIGTYVVKLDGTVVARSDIVALVQNERLRFSDILNQYPLTIIFADGTSVVRGRARILRSLDGAPPVEFRRWAWDGVDLSSESRVPEAGKINILAMTIAEVIAENPDSYLIVDDAANEIADLIVVRRSSARQASVTLVHCKWSSGEKPGHRLADIYEVLAQASRSVRWTVPTLLFPEIARRLGDRASTHIAHGDEKELREILSLYIRTPPRVQWTIMAVQPGLKLDGIGDWIHGNNMIAASGNWCEQQNAMLTICGS